MLTENSLNTNTLKIGALHLAAIASSLASAVVAYPAASHYFGSVAGTVLLAVSALVIYFAWHYVATERNLDNSSLIKRGIAALLAIGFATVMIIGIHTSAQLPQQQATTTAQQQQEQLYQQQEQARIDLINKLTDELRVTSKNRNPDQYQLLQSQIAANSQPLPLPSAASTTVATNNPDYLWIVSAIFEIVTPSLLLLAGFYASRNTIYPIVDTTITPQQPTTTTDNPTTTPPATRQQPEGTGNNIVGALKNRLIPLNDKGNLVASAIMQVTGCNERNARQALKEAVQQGIVQALGSGNATYYQYAEQPRLRVVGQ